MINIEGIYVKPNNEIEIYIKGSLCVLRICNFNKVEIIPDIHPGLDTTISEIALPLDDIKNAKIYLDNKKDLKSYLENLTQSNKAIDKFNL